MSGRLDGLAFDVPDGAAFGIFWIQWTGSGPAFVVGWACLEAGASA